MTYLTCAFLSGGLDEVVVLIDPNKRDPAQKHLLREMQMSKNLTPLGHIKNLLSYDDSVQRSVGGSECRPKDGNGLVNELRR
jgi:hypothetical protein